MYRMPLTRSIVSAYGYFSLAFVPTPSSVPEAPLPAYVVTAPVGVIMRTAFEFPSATYTLLLESTAIPVKALLKRALVPTPLTMAAGETT